MTKRAVPFLGAGRQDSEGPGWFPVLRSRIRAVTLLVTFVAAVACGSWLLAGYRAAVRAQAMALGDLVRNERRVIESLSLSDTSEGAREATLSRLRAAYDRSAGFTQVEIVVARVDGDRIVFEFAVRDGRVEVPDPVALSGERAEPMRRALAGESGTVVGRDYRGARVVAAFEPVPALAVGIVAKTHLSSVRASLLPGALAGLAGAALATALGLGILLRIGSPLVVRLERADEMYRRFFAAAPIGIAVTTETTFEEVNDAVCRIFGAPREDLLGRSLIDFSPEFQPDGRRSAEAAAEHLARAKAGDSPAFEWRHRRLDGSECDVEVVLQSVGVGGEAVIVSLMNDVTDRVASERAVRESRDLLRQLTDGYRGGLAVLDADGRYQFVNHWLVTLADAERPGSFLGQRAWDGLPHDFEARFRDASKWAWVGVRPRTRTGST